MKQINNCTDQYNPGCGHLQHVYRPARRPHVHVCLQNHTPRHSQSPSMPISAPFVKPLSTARIRRALIASETRTSSFGRSQVCHSCFDPWKNFLPLYFLRKVQAWSLVWKLTFPTDPTFSEVHQSFDAWLLSEYLSQIFANHIPLLVEGKTSHH